MSAGQVFEDSYVFPFSPQAKYAHFLQILILGGHCFQTFRCSDRLALDPSYFTSESFKL